MSKQIDQRVVQMQFDNAQFERNVSTTMSTLDKLKQKLNFTGASKGLDNINAATKKIDMSGLSNGVGAVQAKFSALEVMGVTALANITNSAVNAGKRIISALTIDPIKTGFQEYETQINATQTIWANTKSKGTTLDDVNKALEKLNEYADLTIYNFTEMTRNIGTFTAAGVDLDTSVSAIKGIANLAAVSGSTSQQASTAMYQLSQALASGTVKLMDWNSVVNAGMGGEVFQNALKETARIHGVAIDEMIASEGSFRETLKSGWLTSEILTETLNNFTLSAKEGTTQWEEYKKSLMDKGYTEAQAEEILEMGNTATEAATKVKTFTQLWDVLKESAQSGWAQTWKILVGDFEEAKNLLSPLAERLTNFIGKLSDARNILLEKALDNPFADLAKKIETVTGVTEEMTGAVKDYGKVVDDVLNGDFGNGQARWDKLTEAGYDWAKVQNLINAQLDSTVRHTEQVEDAQKSANQTQATTVEQLLEMSDAQLRNLNFTDKEIEGLRQLAEQSEKTGIPIEELIKDMDQLSGRSLLINSFKNVGQGLVAVFTALKDAWTNIFPPMQSDQLYNLIAGLHKLSTHLVVSDETAGKLERTFKGVFAIIDIVTTIVGGAAKIAFKALTQLLGMFNMDILEFTAIIGDTLVGFRDWIDNVLDFTRVFEILIPYTIKAWEAIVKFGTAFKNNSNLQNFLTVIKDIGAAIKDWASGIKDAENVPRYIIEGLANGLRSGARIVWNAMLDLGVSIWESLCTFFDMHSPSRKMESAGENIVAGLANGIRNAGSNVIEGIKNIASNIMGVLSEIDWGALLVSGFGAGMLLIGKKFTDVLDKFASPVEGLGDMFEGIGTFFKDFGIGLKKHFKAKALDNTANAIKNIAIAIGILALSVVVLSKLDPTGLATGIGALIALAGVIVALTKLVDKFGSTGVIEIGKITAVLFGISGALLIMAIAVKTLAGASVDDLAKGVVAIGLLGGMMVGLMAATKLFDKGAGDVGKVLLRMSVAMILLVAVIKLVSGIEPGELGKGLLVISLFSGIFVGLIAMTKLFGKEASAVGGTLLKMSLAILLMVGVTKLVAGMEPAELAKGMLVITAFGLIITGLIGLTSLVGKNVAKIGSTLLAISAAITLLVITAKLAASMSPSEILKGMLVITAFGALCVALVASTSFVTGNDLKRVGATILAMSVAIGIMAGVSVLLGLVDLDTLAQGIIAVGLLTALMIAMTKATQHATDVKGTMAGIGALALMGLVVAELAVILGLMAHFDVNPSIETASALSILLLAMSGACLILAGVGAAGPAAFVGIGALATLIAGIGGLIVAIGALVTEFPKLEEFLNVGIPIIEKIGYALGSFFGNIVGGFIGNLTSGLPEMATDLSNFMTNLTPFLEGAKGIDSNVTTGVESLASALLALTAANVVNAISSWIPGAGSLSDFVEELAGVGEPLAKLASDVGTITPDQLDGIKRAGEALSVMAEAAEGVNGQSEWGKKIFGDNSLGKFAEEIRSFVSKMAGIGTFNKDQLTTVEYAADAIDVIGKAAKKVDGQSEWGTKIFGDNSITKFAGEIKDFVSKMAGMGSFTKEQVSSVKNAGDAISALTKAAKGVDGQAEWSKKIFGDNSLAKFAEDIKAFINAMSNIDVTVMDKFTESMNKLGDSCVEELIEGFAGASTDVEKAGKDIAQSFVKGAKSKYSDFKSAGKYLVEGFAAGINNNTYLAKAKAKAMADAAAQSARAALQVKSPSRVGMSIGAFFGEGFVNGIQSYASSAANAGKIMATSAKTGLSEAVSKIRDFVNNDIDAQPTIRPILDLSDVKSGASTLSGLFNSTAPIATYVAAGAVGNVSSISSQNGNNSDVISAIDRLRYDVRGMDRATYNINGVTYDDGSNISDAVRTIVRAAKIERRS